jgi:hypothetical protein
MAVGGDFNPIAESWNGRLWSIERMPVDSGMADVSCPSANVCIAVGPRESPLAEAVRWNGRRWSRLRIPFGSNWDESALAGISCLSTSYCIAVGYSQTVAGCGETTGCNFQPLIMAWNGARWSIVPTRGWSHVELSGVSCTAVNACMVLGEQAAIARWDGRRLSEQKPPRPRGARHLQLSHVSCVSGGACAVVGSVGRCENARGCTTVPIAERWDGKRWLLQRTPAIASGPRGPGSGPEINGVACTSRTVCIAVGDYWNGFRDDRTAFAERWANKRWALQRAANDPVPLVGTLSGVSCPSATACAVVGSYALGAVSELWNGSRWSRQEVPVSSGERSSVLTGVSCAAATRCVAVGSSADARFLLAERWNGAKWSTLHPLTPTGTGETELTGISCVSTTACTVVGQYFMGSQPSSHGLVEDWNGVTWSIQQLPMPIGTTYSALSGISCASSTACLAVGLYTVDARCIDPSASGSCAYQPLSERWDGNSWTVQQSPLPSGASGGALNGVSCASSTECIAVGSYAAGPGCGYFAPPSPCNETTLAQRWDGTAWTIENTPMPNGPAAELTAVSCPTSGACTAVGEYEHHSTKLPLTENWNGINWSLQSTPAPSHGESTTLTGISCSSRVACMSVGSHGPTAASIPFAQQRS